MSIELSKQLEGFSDESFILFLCDDFLFFRKSIDLIESLTKDFEMEGVLVIMNSDANIIAEELEKKEVDTDELYFIDCVSLIAGMSPPNLRHCYTIGHPSNLDDIMIAIERSLNSLTKKKFVVFFSPFIFNNYMDINNCGLFFYQIQQVIKQEKVLDMFMSEKDRGFKINGLLVNLADVVIKT